MENLKPLVNEYLQVKENIKALTERKKLLEESICITMSEHNIATLELPEGKNLKYKTKDELKLSKEKGSRAPRKRKDQED